MTDRDGFLFYRSYLDTAEKLPKARRYPFLQAIVQYALDGVEPDFKGMEDIAFTAMRANIDSSNKRYQASVKNGKKGGRPLGKLEETGSKTPKKQPGKNLEKTQRKPRDNPAVTQHKPSRNLTDTDTVTVKETVSGSVKGLVSCVGGLTSPPTPQEKDGRGRETDGLGRRKIIE